MAMIRTANAVIQHPSVGLDQWNMARANALGAGGQHGSRVASSMLNKYSPDKYLLTHCTIIASVDVDEAPSVKTGSKVKNADGEEINRPHADYLIKPDCSQYINQNGDAWERKLLLATYPTFVGAENYVEHIQVPELSKGKVIDAVARDLGDTVYIDILVATDRKHVDLIRRIESGELNTLSMGCFLKGTPITMADGTHVPIEDVVPGDMVLTHKGRAREVANIQRHHWQGDVIEIESAGHRIPVTATDNHPFWVLRPQEHCACGCGEPLEAHKSRDPMVRVSKRFKRGHNNRLLNPNATYSLEEYRERRAQMDEIQSLDFEWVDAGDLREGDYVAFPKTSVEVAPEDVDEDLARFVGYFAAEGSYLKSKGTRTGCELTFSLEERDTYVQDVVSILTARDISHSVYDRGDRNTSVVRIHDAAFSDWVYEMTGEYSWAKRLRSDVLTWPEQLKRQFLTGYMRGDGCLNTSNQTLECATVSYDLWCQLYALFASCGAFAHQHIVYEGVTAQLDQVVNGGAVVSAGSNGKRPAFYLKLSQSQAQRFPEFGYDVEPPCREQRLRELGDYVVFPITSLRRKSYDGVVYNFEVEEDHSYIASGYAVHNCTIAYSICTKCGNKAKDDTELCRHVKYEKGNKFVGPDGQIRVVGELCGHHTDPESVVFIEASWVGNPAFKGAVMRNILEGGPTEHVPGRYETTDLSKRIEQAYANPTAHPDWTDMFQKTAAASAAQITEMVNRQIRLAFGFEDEDEEGGEEPEKSPLEEAVDQYKERVKDRAMRELREELRDEPERKDMPGAEMAPNDSIQHSSVDARTAYALFTRRYARELPDLDRRRRIFALLYTMSSRERYATMRPRFANSDIVAALYLADRENPERVARPQRFYAALVQTGGLRRYASKMEYLRALKASLGCTPRRDEAEQALHHAFYLN